MDRLKKIAAVFTLFAACALAQIPFAITAPTVGAAAPTFATYQPVFQADVYVINPYVANPAALIQKQNQVNPAYALSETSALELSVVLKDYGATIFHSGPFGWLTAGQFTVTRTVPWIQFPNGAVVNAGLIAWYFSHGLPASLVEQWVRSDIEAWLKYWPDHAADYAWIVKQP